MPNGIRSALESDPLWKVQAFRESIFAIDVARDDCRLLAGARLLEPIASQLYRAVCSIGANISEGYSRGTGRDRARFYEYSLGSLRESIVWYQSARMSLPDERLAERGERFTSMRRLLLTMIQDQRRFGRGAGVGDSR